MFWLKGTIALPHFYPFGPSYPPGGSAMATFLYDYFHGAVCRHSQAAVPNPWPGSFFLLEWAPSGKFY